MKTVTLFLIVLFLTSCASMRTSDNFKRYRNLATKQWQSNRGGAEYEDYLTRWGEFNNKNKIDEKGDCYKLGSEEVNMVIVINASGVVEKVVTDSDNAKAKCFAASYTGVNFPAPPKAPIYINMVME